MGCSLSKDNLVAVIPPSVKPQPPETPSIKTTNFQPDRFIENCRVIWFCEDPENKYRTYQERLNKFIYDFKIFNDNNKCRNFVENIQEERVFLIFSSTIYDTIEQFQHLSQIEKIYVFMSGTISSSAERYRSAKCEIIHDIEILCQNIQYDIELCEMDLMLTTGLSTSSLSNITEKQKTEFLFQQVIKDVLCRLKFEAGARDVFIDFCRLHYASNSERLHIIEEFATNHRPNKAITWLTNQSLVSRIMNRIYRTYEIDVIYKLGFYLKQAHLQLNHIRETNATSLQEMTIVYRGKTMSTNEFDIFIKMNRGGFLSFSSFILANTNKNSSIDFINYRLSLHPDMIGIVCEIYIDHHKSNNRNPFAIVDNDSREVCFFISTVFRVQSSEEITNSPHPIWLVKLTIVHDDDEQLKAILSPILNDETQANPGPVIAKLLLDMGDYNRAERYLLKLLLDPSISHQPRRLGRLHNVLANVYMRKEEFENSLTHHQHALELNLTYLAPDHPDLIPVYKSIADDYFNLKDYMHSIENYEKAIDLLKSDMQNTSLDMIPSMNACIDKAKQLMKKDD